MSVYRVLIYYDSSYPYLISVGVLFKKNTENVVVTVLM